MEYGPGASAKIWTQMFENVNFIEIVEECVTKHKEEIENGGYEVFVGSQSDPIFLEKTANILRGFEVVIDDGGHSNDQLIISLSVLWPYVLPGGLYFAEDFGESTYFGGGIYGDSYKSPGIPTVIGEEFPGTFQWKIKRWMENLFCEVSGMACGTLEFMECQMDICVFRKA